MEDGGDLDEKIIALPFGDPTYASFKSIHEMPKHMTDEMMHFFTVYKELEGKKTFISRSGGHKEAQEVIAKCIAAYNKKYAGEGA